MLCLPLARVKSVEVVLALTVKASLDATLSTGRMKRKKKIVRIANPLAARPY
jgi:hypothetical protein